MLNTRVFCSPQQFVALGFSEQRLLIGVAVGWSPDSEVLSFSVIGKGNRLLLKSVADTRESNSSLTRGVAEAEKAYSYAR